MPEFCNAFAVWKKEGAEEVEEMIAKLKK